MSNSNIPDLPKLDVHRLYTPKNAAPYLDQSVSQTYRDIQRGRLRAVDHNGLKIPGHEIARVASLPAESAAA